MTNWVYDELFASPKAKELLELSNLNGFTLLNVLNKSGREVLADIYQMQIPYIMPEGIETSSNCIEKVSNCPACGRKKFLSNERGQFMLSIALDHDTHKGFTKAWREILPYGKSHTVDDIWSAAQDIYRDFPELLEAARKTIWG